MARRQCDSCGLLEASKTRMRPIHGGKLVGWLGFDMHAMHRTAGAADGLGCPPAAHPYANAASALACQKCDDLWQLLSNPMRKQRGKGLRRASAVSLLRRVERRRVALEEAEDGRRLCFLCTHGEQRQFAHEALTRPLMIRAVPARSLTAYITALARRSGAARPAVSQLCSHPQRERVCSIHANLIRHVRDAVADCDRTCSLPSCESKLGWPYAMPTGERDVAVACDAVAGLTDGEVALEELSNKPVCRSCRYVLSKGAGDAGHGLSQIAEHGLRRLVVWVLEELKVGSERGPSMLVKVAFAKYCELCQQKEEEALTERAFLIRVCPVLLIYTIDMSPGIALGRGRAYFRSNVSAREEAARKMVADAVEIAEAKYTVEQERADLDFLAQRLAHLRPQYESQIISITSEVAAVPRRLWERTVQVMSSEWRNSMASCRNLSTEPCLAHAVE